MSRQVPGSMKALMLVPRGLKKTVFGYAAGDSLRYEIVAQDEWMRAVGD